MDSDDDERFNSGQPYKKGDSFSDDEDQPRNKS